jgi:5,10-methylenetetrahydromethanopterin reductase
VARVPDLGIRFHSGMNSHRCVALARAAEFGSFASIWFAENPFERGVLPAASACAVATERVRIGIGVFNPYNRHPTLMAMEAGALDELSNGRAVLGIGSGVPQWINRIMPHERPLSALRDAAIISRELLAGKTVTYRGKMFSADHVRLGFRPGREQVPVYLAAMADQALKLCGAVGDGLIIGNMCPPAYTQHASDMLRLGAETSGRSSPASIVKYVPCSINRDEHEARRAVKPAIGAMLSSYWAAYENSPGVRSAIGDNNDIESSRFARALQHLAEGSDPTTELDDAFVAAYALAGTAEQCLAQSAALAEGGVTEVVMSFVGNDPESQMKQLTAALRAS